MITTDMHLHSSFSDGENTPEEIVREAIRLGYREIAITEHVRRTTDWLDDFCQEMSRLKQLYSTGIRLHSGIEAKVINLKGDLDACPEFFSQVDLTLGAFHRIPVGDEQYLSAEDILKDKERALNSWFEAMMNLLQNSRVTMIAHPTAILKRNNINVPFDLKIEIAKKAAECDKILELNARYQVPDSEFVDLLENHNVKTVFGSDSHSVQEMRAIAAIRGGKASTPTERTTPEC